MKDAFFAWSERAYHRLYCLLLRFTFWTITLKLTKGLPDIPRERKKEIRRYWKEHLGIRVPLREYRFYQAQGLELDPRLIPCTVWHSIIEPYFGCLTLTKAFSDKNYLDLYVGADHAPQTLCRCVSGTLLDRDYRLCSPEEICAGLQQEEEVICKPSIDSGGGRGIQFLRSRDITPEVLAQLSRQYHRNFVIQKILRQHPFYSQFHPESLNTLRIVTLLFRGKMHLLTAALRIGGTGHRVDNVSNGGAAVYVDSRGYLQNRVYRKNPKTQKLQQDTEFLSRWQLEDAPIPGWDRILSLLEKTHARLAHFGLIYWDVAMQEDGCPVFIECNLLNSSVYSHQVRGGPIFGDLTEEVLHEIRDSRKKK